MYKILIVEDDVDLAAITDMNLRHAGYDTDVAGSCSDALSCLHSNSYDLLLVDMLLPDGDGRSLCRTVRRDSHCPVIFFSCLDDSEHMVSALDEGGDDYVVKPVRYDVLLARIAANLRRYKSYQHREAGHAQAGSLRRFKSFALDTVHRRAVVGNEEIDLSSIEYNLLSYMVDNPDTLLLYDELYNRVWVNDSLGDVRTVMVHISNLRKKVDPGKAGIIKTVRGAGYVFCDA